MRAIAIYAGFMKDFAALERPVQERVKDSLTKFRNDELPGSHVEKIHGAANNCFRSVRVTKSVRAIVAAPTGGRTYTLLKVLPHDDAYAWARRSTMSVSAGRLEIIDPEDFLTRVDNGTTVDAVTLDPTSVQPAIDDVLDLNIDAAIANTPDQVHVVSSDEDFERILEYPFDLWRIYLHPSQVQIVEADYRGPARVTGGPGTGKTVVCVHRARRLAEKNDGYVLLVTFTKSLAEATQRAIDKLVDDETVRNRIRVRTVDAFARRVFDHYHGPLGDENRLITRPENVWRRIIRDLDLAFDAKFLQDEFVHVVLAQQITSEEQYLSARRRGRGQRLLPNQRKQVWAAVTRFDQHLVETESWTFETLCREAAVRLAATRAGEHAYRYVVVDEAQDLSPDHWRLLRGAVPMKSENSIFIAGDARQRIYQHRVALRQIGIDITGRSRRLDLNHRTSEEILRWALKIFDGVVVDDLEDEAPDDTEYRSLFTRHAPVLKATDTPRDELDYVIETITLWCESGIALDDIGIAVRELKYVPGVRAALEANGIGTRKSKSASTAGVTIASMHSMKGLEFRCMVVMGVGADTVPPKGAVTPESVDKVTHDLDEARERQLLFVACTRAREDLLVTWVGEPSRLLPLESVLVE